MKSTKYSEITFHESLFLKLQNNQHPQHNFYIKITHFNTFNLATLKRFNLEAPFSVVPKTYKLTQLHPFSIPRHNTFGL